ncbi:hypothetical protein J5N97_012443 [Dioscorea zingiberensis]|uniref:Uncharacterized protein n=1 Tax=Dioscorea zingiberensis TaxID=325984 RepID=A0A9D5HHT1_9LILI|nr:hypothetical protein J5N97_012443 [Dioscorea zingiberensis]
MIDLKERKKERRIREMVCKVVETKYGRQESMEKKNKNEQEMVRLQCNKGKACRFKRSCFSQEDDAASSAILLLACVVFSPPSSS